MIIQTSNRQEDFQIDDELTSDIEKSIRICLLQELNDDNYEISLSFVSEAEIRKLNSDYRDKDSVTDVLSFPLDDDFAIQTNLLGDIIICCKRAIEQAKEAFVLMDSSKIGAANFASFAHINEAILITNHLTIGKKNLLPKQIRVEEARS